MSLNFSLHTDESIKMDDGCCVFDIQITGNFRQMATRAEIANILWAEGENQKFSEYTAGDIVDGLVSGLLKACSNPGLFKPVENKNGWGSYDEFIQVLASVIIACRENPDTRIYRHY